MNKIYGFDIEIVKEISEGQDWKELRPLGISCAAVYYGMGNIYWYPGWHTLSAPENKAMDKDETMEMEDSLFALTQFDNKVVTWNGLSFDFRVLADESGMLEECSYLAMNHVDMMFQILCIKGYPAGLNAVAKGMGLEGKTEGMSGALAPIMWKGTDEDRKKVIEYVIQDAKTTYEVYKAIEEHKYIKWTSKSGKPQFMPIPKWLTVKECLSLPLPDTSWMTNPMKREDMYSWCKL